MFERIVLARSHKIAWLVDIPMYLRTLTRPLNSYLGFFAESILRRHEEYIEEKEDDMRRVQSIWSQPNDVLQYISLLSFALTLDTIL